MSTSRRKHSHSCAVITVCLAALLAASATPPAANAQGPCVANMNDGVGRFGKALSFTPNVHTGCTNGVAQGQVTHCTKLTDRVFTFINVFSAVWVSSAARLSDPTGGCVFMCASGDCRVGNDGLPVELLQFGVK